MKINYEDNGSFEGLNVSKIGRLGDEIIAVIGRGTDRPDTPTR